MRVEERCLVGIRKERSKVVVSSLMEKDTMISVLLREIKCPLVCRVVYCCVSGSIPLFFLATLFMVSRLG